MTEPNKYERMAEQARAMSERALTEPAYSGNGFNFISWSEAITDFAALIDMSIQHRPRGQDGKPSPALVEAVAAVQASVADFMRAFPDTIPAITVGAFGD